MPSAKKKKIPFAIPTPPLEQLQGPVGRQAGSAIAEVRSKTGEMRAILVWPGRCKALPREGLERKHGAASLNSGGTENHARSDSSAVT